MYHFSEEYVASFIINVACQVSGFLAGFSQSRYDNNVFPKIIQYTFFYMNTNLNKMVLEFIQ